jgi:hypothetical protein
MNDKVSAPVGSDVANDYNSLVEIADLTVLVDLILR